MKGTVAHTAVDAHSGIRLSVAAWPEPTIAQATAPADHGGMSTVEYLRRSRASTSDRIYDAARDLSTAALALEAESRRRIGAVESLATTLAALQETLQSLWATTDALTEPSARTSGHTTHHRLGALAEGLRGAALLCEDARRSAGEHPRDSGRI